MSCVERISRIFHVLFLALVSFTLEAAFLLVCSGDSGQGTPVLSTWLHLGWQSRRAEAPTASSLLYSWPSNGDTAPTGHRKAASSQPQSGVPSVGQPSLNPASLQAEPRAASPAPKDLSPGNPARQVPPLLLQPVLPPHPRARQGILDPLY